MKQVLYWCVWLLPFVPALGQPPAAPDPWPTLPLRFVNARRFDPTYVDSVVTQTRQQVSRLETLPRSPITDTLRLELLRYLSYCYRYAQHQEDSIPVVSRRLIRVASQLGNVRFQVAGYLELHHYYHTIKQDFPQALRVNYEALRLTERHPVVADEYLWRVQANLGQISFRIGKYQESITLYRTAYANLARDLQASRTERINVLQLTGESYLYLNRLDSAEHFSLRALSLANPRSSTHQTMAYLYADLGEVYLRQHRYDEALTQLGLAEDQWYQSGQTKGLAGVWANKAHVYYLTQQYEQALVYARKALQYETGSPRTRLLIYEMLSLASAARHDWEAAYRFHQRFKAVADSIQSRRKLSETMTLQARFEREKLELRQQREQQRYRALEQEKALQEQRYLTLARETELTQLRATTEQERLRQVASQAELQRQLETEALKTQARMRQNRQQNQIRTLYLTSLQNQIRLQAQTRNFGLAFAGFMALSLLGYTQLLRRKNQTLRQKNSELEAAQHHGQTQEMAALRAQMNPHFIFNCINSIKLYTLQNDTDRASDYLTKFARLIRLVLENSRSERVPLQNELEMLRLYLDMEVMRFKQKLRFQITVSPDIDTQFTEIPPLLIQPYVENAIWHGLMHKPEGGTVTVTVQQDGDLLTVTIADDGVGRTRAAELKSKSANARRSFGMKMTSDRIALINDLYKTRTFVTIHDLLDADGQPAGTEVVLTIPI